MPRPGVHQGRGQTGVRDVGEDEERGSEEEEQKEEEEEEEDECSSALGLTAQQDASGRGYCE